MGSQIVDGNRWLEERAAFLRERLQGDLADSERDQIEVELGQVEHERAVSCTGLSAGRLWAYLRRRNRSSAASPPPEP